MPGTMPVEWLSVAEARALPGLRLVLTRGVPGPWGELAKGILHVKGIPYARVAQDAGGENAELREWTGHANAPIAILDDEPPRAGRLEILWLAERLAPKPALLPADPELRATVLGWCDAIAGENGFGWQRRLLMIDALKRAETLPGPLAAVRDRLAIRYGYRPDAAAAAPAQLVSCLRGLAGRLHAQRERGSDFLIGDALSVADITWAAFAGLLRPLPDALCPMPAAVRASYETPDPRLDDACDPILFEHRDRIYERFLELPVRL
ncbi:MAG: hypothetical protein QNK05_05970 [Myxococcota bacterium]|nr:hypothetical protein [Myxococcota bacterium]